MVNRLATSVTRVLALVTLIAKVELIRTGQHIFSQSHAVDTVLLFGVASIDTYYLCNLHHTHVPNHVCKPQLILRTLVRVGTTSYCA